MDRYRPQFEDEHIVALARARGLLDDHESLVDGIDRVGRALGQIDSRLCGGADDFTEDLLAELRTGRVAVSSQLFAAAGRSDAAAACTVLPVVGTTDAGRLRRLIAEATAASAVGMGCGMDVSDFTEPADALTAINSALLKVHHELTAARRRPPALMVSCRGDHPRIEEFISAKGDADFSAYVANISVRLCGDEVEWQRLRPLLAAAAHRNGEPGVLFQNIADADNPTPGIALTSTAPCAEVFLSPGERCVFVTVNLAAHVNGGAFDWAGFERSVRLAVRAGDAAVELACAGAAAVVANRRRIGVGVCGYHSALIRLGIPYARCVDFAQRICELLTFTAHDASADLAIQRGAFPICGDSRWLDAAWLRRKAQRRTGAIDPGSWDALEHKILATGIRNAAVVAYPPTGVVAELLGVSRSYEPHYTLAGRTGIAATSKLSVACEVEGILADRPHPAQLQALILDPMTGHQLPGVGPDDLLACARQLPPAVHLAVHSAFSGMADESGSKTINLPADATIADIAGLLDQARTLGLKGITVFRDGCLSERSNAA
jgi:ribonucleoside-diphosphate reductase alpha chain